MNGLDQRREKMQKALNLVLGFVLGGLFGGAIGLLLTPMSGDELRSEVREYSRQIKQDVDSAATAKRVQLEHELANLRGEVVSE
jgi:gas vesicle protein